MRYEIAPQLAEVARRQAAVMRRFSGAFEGVRDSALLAHHKLVTESGREWEHPEAVLTDEQIEFLEARALSRTLSDIDDLPSTD